MPDDMPKDEQKKDAKKGGSKLKLILIIGVALAVVAGGGAAAVMLLGGHPKAHAEGAAPAEKPKPTTAVVNFETFIVNLADPKGDRLLKATLRAVVSDSAIAASLTGDDLIKARVRDRIISVLTSKMYADISTPAGKDALRRELAKEINGALPNDGVQEVLFADFAAQ